MPASEPAQEAVLLRLAPCGAATCVVAELPGTLAARLAARTVSEREWRRAFPVRTEEAAASEPPGPTIFGAYALEGATLTFRPRLPLLSDTGYVAVLRPAVLARLAGKGAPAAPDPARLGEVELRFRLPAPRRDPPRVTAIHPVSGEVPANLLRAYVHFSAPMRPDVARRYVNLLDGSGHAVALPFVEIEGGLWDRSHTRLTLLFHPGRIKRGVSPREALGPPLEEGRRYRLVVEPGWPAATGEPLAERAEVSWRAGPPDREPVAPARWTVQVPPAGTADPLRVDFGEPLDHALALRLIGVARGGSPVAGAATLDADGACWSFTPEEPWLPTDHELRVEPALEDLAGNNLRGAFDREPGAQEAEAATVRIPFRPTG